MTALGVKEASSPMGFLPFVAQLRASRLAQLRYCDGLSGVHLSVRPLTRVRFVGASSNFTSPSDAVFVPSVES